MESAKKIVKRSVQKFHPSADTRPLGDKHYQLHCSKTIIDYLHQIDPDCQLSLKNMQSPKAKEYLLIVKSLLLQIDPTFELQGKIEDEIPALFRSLGYPFVISKSALLAVGAPNTWPSLLGSLMWLVEVVQVPMNCICSDSPENLFVAYEQYSKGQDYSSEIQDLISEYELKISQTLSKIESLKEVINNLKQEHRTISSALQDMYNIDYDIELAMTKNTGFCSHEALVTRREMLREALENAIEKEKTIWQSVEEKENELFVLKEKIAQQEYSADYILKIEENFSVTEESLATSKEQMAVLQNNRQKSQEKLSVLTKKCSDEVRNYRTTASSLRMIPKGAKYSYDFDLNIEFSIDSSDEDHLLRPKDVLFSLRKACNMAEEEIFIQLERSNRLLCEHSKINQDLMKCIADLKKELQRIEMQKNEYEQACNNRAIFDQIEYKRTEIEAIEKEIKQNLNVLDNLADQYNKDAKIEEELSNKIKHINSNFQIESKASSKMIEDSIFLAHGHFCDVSDYLTEIQSWLEKNFVKISKSYNNE